MRCSPPASRWASSFTSARTVRLLGWILNVAPIARAPSFKDPDGNTWVLQEITGRLPGRVETGVTSFSSATDLASALRCAATAHGQHETRTGQRDANWPDWYAEYMVREQTGQELPP